MLVSARYSKDGRCDQCVKLGLKPEGAPEEHGELFRAARTLFEKGVTDEDLIVPTPAFAARTWDMPYLARLRDWLSKAGEGSEAWEDLWRLFIDAFGTLQPDRVVDGVPIIWRAPFYVGLYPFDPREPKTNPVEEITIDVHALSVKPRHVKAKYARALKMAGIPCERWDRGSVNYKAYKGYLRVLVRPEDTKGVDQVDKMRIRLGQKQLPFPPPANVESFYEGIWRCFGHEALKKGRQSGVSFMPKNLIPACVAWYVGGHGALLANTKLRQRVVRVLDDNLFGPLGKDTIESKSSDSARQLWKAVENT